MSAMYSFGSIIGKTLTVDILGYQIAAGILEWGLLMAVIPFILNVMFTAMGRHFSAGLRIRSFIGSVITAPIVEEILYRFLLITLFMSIFNSPLVAVILSAFLFAMLHILYGGLTFLDCFIGGLLWGWAFLNLGIGVTIIAHMAHNLMVTVTNAM